MAKTAQRIETPSPSPTAPRERRPFARLEPTTGSAALPGELHQGLTNLELCVGTQIAMLTRALVTYTLTAGRADTIGRRTPPTISVLNRRRRAARLWIQAILAGRVDDDTRHTVATSLMPKLIGCGPEIHRAERAGELLVEYVRGAMHAAILDRPAANLVPEAAAIHALDTVLANHLDAFVQTARARRQAAHTE